MFFEARLTFIFSCMSFAVVWCIQSHCICFDGRKWKETSVDVT